VSELAIRAVTGIGLIVVALMAAVLGGYVFAVVVAAAAAVMFYEWTRMTKGWGVTWYIGGILYALLPALALLWVRESYIWGTGFFVVLWIFIVTWSTDIGAYFAGRRFGKHKLAPNLSPNKTVEGLIGGVVSATVLGGAYVLALGFVKSFLLLAPLFALAAQAGDLFESGMKRRAGVKDSGHWLPGHGGLLDRLDGLVPVAVLTFAAQVAGLT
jgi:phosphatidate cytidylyltransferase